MRVPGCVVDPREQQVLHEELAVGELEVVVGGLEHLPEGMAARGRHDGGAQGVVGGMEGEGQIDLGRLPRQAADPSGQSDGGDGQGTLGQTQSVPVVEEGECREDGVQVEQRLAHSHEHHVGQSRALGGQQSHGRPRLVHDLGRCEVAAEADAAGNAERAAQRAADLARHAQRGPAPVAHEHALEAQAVRRLQEHGRGAVLILPETDLLHRRDPERVQGPAQVPRQGRGLGEGHQRMAHEVLVDLLVAVGGRASSRGLERHRAGRR